MRGRAWGEQAIIIYKLTRACVQGLAALLLLLTGARSGLGVILALAAHRMADHAVHATVAAVAHRIVMALPHLQLLGAVLAVDAGLAALEGWSLARGHRWGEWLVVVTTGSLLPWEVWELLRRHSLVRLLLLVVNIAVVLYLARRIVRRHRMPHDPARL
jgi:uncharacterized membrane protein (DUF2068 family)